MNQLQMLEKIAIIEKAITEIKESISDNQLKESAPNPVQWDKFLKSNTRALILSLIDKYGYNVSILRTNKFIAEKLWEHRVTDFAQVLNTLKERNFCKIESYFGTGNRIQYFKFIKP
jgi:hypothetical protein